MSHLFPLLELEVRSEDGALVAARATMTPLPQFDLIVAGGMQAEAVTTTSPLALMPDAPPKTGELGAFWRAGFRREVGGSAGSFLPSSCGDVRRRMHGGCRIRPA